MPPLREIPRGSLSFRFAVLVGTMNDVVANGCGIITSQHILEGHHAGILERSVQQDLIPKVVAEEIGGAQVGNHAAADGSFAVADAAVAAKQCVTVRDGGRITRLGWWIDNE